MCVPNAENSEYDDIPKGIKNLDSGYMRTTTRNVGAALFVVGTNVLHNLVINYVTVALLFAEIRFA